MDGQRAEVSDATAGTAEGRVAAGYCHALDNHIGSDRSCATNYIKHPKLFVAINDGLVRTSTRNV